MSDTVDYSSFFNQAPLEKRLYLFKRAGVVTEVYRAG